MQKKHIFCSLCEAWKLSTPWCHFLTYLIHLWPAYCICHTNAEHLNICLYQELSSCLVGKQRKNQLSILMPWISWAASNLGDYHSALPGHFKLLLLKLGRANLKTWNKVSCLCSYPPPSSYYRHLLGAWFGLCFRFLAQSSFLATGKLTPKPSIW